MAATVTRPKIDAYAVASCIVVPTQDEHATERKDGSAIAKLMRLQRRYDAEGQCVMSVEAVIVVHAHNHPHILLLKRAVTTATTDSVLSSTSTTQPSHVTYRLPGGKIRGTETASDCLYRKLARDILGHAKDVDADHAPEETTGDSQFVMHTRSGGAPLQSGGRSTGQSGVATAQQAGLRVGEVLAVWCRPNFDRAIYPYVPAHVSEPKELRTICIVHMPSECMLAVSEPHTELVAIPLFDLYENAAKYGALIASIPHMLSRFVINVC